MSIETLPGDQRAVLQLVLARGRSYDEIARLLSINPNSVRERALAALDALGPETSVSSHERERIGDYLLGQLPADQIDSVRALLSQSPRERAWARELSRELSPIAAGPLPEISVGAAPAPPPPAPAPETLAAGPAEPRAPEAAPYEAPAPPPQPDLPPPSEPPTAARRPRREPARDEGGPPPRRRSVLRLRGRSPGILVPRGGDGPRSSRLGGVLVIAIVVAIVIVLLIVLIGGGSSSTPPSSSTKTQSTTSSTPASASSSQTSTTAKVVSQITLTPPSSKSKASGIAEVLSEGSTYGIAIVAKNVPANSVKPPNAYAVWLYNSPTDAKIAGFVNPGVGASGRLSTAGPLPTNAASYHEIIVTIETSGTPSRPGPIVLQGTLTGL